MDDYFERGRSSRQTIGFFVVLALHGLMIWGLMSGLVQKVTEEFIAELKPVSEPPPPPDAEIPPPPPPDIIKPPPFVPPPDFEISTEAPSETAIRDVTSKPPPAGPTIGVRQDPKHPPSKPDYPASAKRLEQEGPVGLLIYVGADGRVIEVQVEKSSGYPALDASAVREAKTWRLLPAQTEGKPVAAWYRAVVKFRLEDA